MVKMAGKVYKDEEDLYTILCSHHAVILSPFSLRDFSPKVETAIAVSENDGKVFCITKFKEDVVKEDKQVVQENAEEDFVHLPCRLLFKSYKTGESMGEGNAEIKLTKSTVSSYSIDGVINFDFYVS